MKKLFLIFSFLVFTLCSCDFVQSNDSNKTDDETKEENKKDDESKKEEEVEPPLPNLDSTKSNTMNSYIDSLMSNTDSYIPSWNQEGFKGRWNYIDGVFLKSIVDLYNKTNDTKYINFVKTFVDYYIDESGNFLNLRTDVTQPGYNLGELDSVCESKVLFDLYSYTNEERYKTAIDYTYNALSNQLKLDDGICYAHKTSYSNQVWLDGFYMYAPFVARYAKVFNHNEIFDSLYNQYKYVRNHMYDETKKLYYHGYSYTNIFWANDNKCSSSFWTRSIGWFVSSLADTIEYYPDGDKKTELIKIYQEALDGVLNYLDKSSNMFYQVTDKGNQSKTVSYSKYLKYLNKKYSSDTVLSNYLESSGSSLIAYSLLKGYNSKVLKRSYYDNGFNIFNGVYDKSFKNNELGDICITAGLGPSDKTYRDGSFDYYLAEPVGKNDAKGVGPFIMAFIEIQ